VARISKARKDELAAQIVELVARGWNFAKIGKHLHIDRRTASKFYKDELADRAEHRDHEREKSIAQYEAVIKEAWARLEGLNSNSLNVSGLLNAIRQAQQAIDDLTGVKAPTKVQHTPGEEVEVYWDDEGLLTSDD